MGWLHLPSEYVAPLERRRDRLERRDAIDRTRRYAETMTPPRSPGEWQRRADESLAASARRRQAPGPLLPRDPVALSVLVLLGGGLALAGLVLAVLLLVVLG